MTLETGRSITSRIVQLPAGAHFVRVRNREGCLSTASNEVAITVAASAIDDVNAIAFRCPTAAEMATVDGDIQWIFEGDPSAGTTVCTVGTRQLTFLQTNAYRALIVMRRQTFDAPLPWTSESLYDWLIHAVRAIRFRSDITFSFCCDPANTINIQTGVSIATPSPDDPASVAGISTLFVHEARHNESRPHTCGNNDLTLAELGAWGAQYYTSLWLADHSDPSFMPARIRDSGTALGANRPAEALFDGGTDDDCRPRVADICSYQYGERLRHPDRSPDHSAASDGRNATELDGRVERAMVDRHANVGTRTRDPASVDAVHLRTCRKSAGHYHAHHHRNDGRPRTGQCHADDRGHQRACGAAVRQLRHPGGRRHAAGRIDRGDRLGPRQHRREAGRAVARPAARRDDAAVRGRRERSAERQDLHRERDVRRRRAAGCREPECHHPVQLSRRLGLSAP